MGGPERGLEAGRGQSVSDTWTIRRVLAWTSEDFAGRGIDSARLDADLLVAHALNLDRIQLYLDPDRPLAAEELVAIRELVARRRAREPVAYILGEREFHGRSFQVSAAVLVPRPDTETLVEQALERLPAADAPCRILDLCTGSGAVAVTLAAERPDSVVVGTDISEEALEVAAVNGARHVQQSELRWYQGDLFEALEDEPPFDCITANPPYIERDVLPTLAPEVSRHEPALALDGGRDGLDFYRRIAGDATRWLLPGAWLLLEVGAGQAPRVVAALGESGFVEPSVHEDLAGIQRVVVARRAL
mgnify:CR=1 FL=1